MLSDLESVVKNEGCNKRKQAAIEDELSRLVREKDEVLASSQAEIKRIKVWAEKAVIEAIEREKQAISKQSNDIPRVS